uniref:Uncharacterized protein n=1 Tax=Arundo donax TaxID=35708 RepID=A0A0A8ZMA8_ARUDO
MCLADLYTDKASEPISWNMLQAATDLHTLNHRPGTSYQLFLPQSKQII